MGENEFNDIFLKDLHKFFLSHLNKENPKTIQEGFSTVIKNIENFIKNNCNQKIKKIFHYILAFMHCFTGDEYVLMIDQYKSDLIDLNFENLNTVVDFIITNKNVIPLKIIVASSMTILLINYYFRNMEYY